MGDDLNRAWLAHYGAPLLGKGLVSGRVAPALEKVVVEALALSRRDASVARALPVLLWLRRADLDMVKLRWLAASRGRERTLTTHQDTNNVATVTCPGRPPTVFMESCGFSIRLVREGIPCRPRRPPVPKASAPPSANGEFVGRYL